MLNRIPFMIAILGMTGGVFIAILFGVNEDIFKNKIQEGLSRNIKIQEMVDSPEKTAKISAEAEKNWRYYQRFHFHATGIGAMMLSLLLFLGRLRAPRKPVEIAMWMISVGGFLYPFVWLFAGLYGPEMGRSEAKEAFAVFGYMGGIFLVGCALTLGLTVKYPLKD